MASSNPQQLLGFVIGALDDAQRRRVEDAVSDSPALQREVAALAEQVGPLLAQRRSVDPPRGLAARTCRAVALAAQVTGTAPAKAVATPAASAAHSMPPVRTPPSGISRWRWPDLIVTACIVACSVLLVIPAMYRARLQAHVPEHPGLGDVQSRLASEQLGYDEYRRRQGEIPRLAQVASPRTGFAGGCRSLFPESVFASPNDSDWLGAEDLPAGYIRPVLGGVSR